MKKIILLLVLSTVLFSCKNSEEKKEDDQTSKTEVKANPTAPNREKMYRGEFIYTKDAAVLKGKDFIYGVTMNDEAAELAKQVAKIVKDDYDMVPVIVEGDLANKKEGAEGWDQTLTITKILNVSKIVVKPDIKLEEPTKKNQ